MLTGPCVRIAAPLEARARYLVSAYADIIADRAALEDALIRLPGRHGAKRLAEWLALSRAGDFVTLAGSLMPTITIPPTCARAARMVTGCWEWWRSPTSARTGSKGRRRRSRR